VNGSSLLVLFSGWVYKSSLGVDFISEFTGRVYGLGLQVGFTNQIAGRVLKVKFVGWVYGSNVEFKDRVCGSWLGSYYTGSNLILGVVFSIWNYGWIYRSIVGVVFTRQVYDRIYWIGLRARFFDQVYCSCLRV